MSSPSLPSEAPTEVPAALAEHLRQLDNPFDDYVQARRVTRASRRAHVEEINGCVVERLQAVMARYRELKLGEDGQVLAEEVPRSGVLVVYGTRGAGKTHLLLHVLQAAETQALVVSPTHYEAHRPFAEYLLHQLVRRLQEEAACTDGGRLYKLADWWTRRVAAQALFGMTETEWLRHQAPEQRLRFLGALWGWGTASIAAQKKALISRLQADADALLIDICHDWRFPPHVLQQVAQRHLQQSEPEQTIGEQIRRRLYLHLVQLAFAREQKPIFEFLLDGYTQVAAETSPSRETLVEELLRALVELCLLYGHPIVFAFDSLETLLHDPPAADRCHPFFRGLADVVDLHQGIPFVILAESSHWEQIQRYQSWYAQNRLQQGVPSRGFGSLREIRLPALTVDLLKQIVARRMQPALSAYFKQPIRGDESLLPFAAADIEQVARNSADAPPLRQALQRLRDVYEELVFGRGGDPLADIDPRRPAETADAPLVAEKLQELWSRELRASQRLVESEPAATFADRLHLGVARWLECLRAEGVALQGWRPTEVENQIWGNHPTYGQYVRCQWSREGREYTTGIGFLLGKGNGMPNDLKSKLGMMATSRPPVDELIILWPRETDGPGPAHQLLPLGTRNAWDRFVQGDLAARVFLEALDPLQYVAPWLVLSNWDMHVQNQEEPLPLEAANHFVTEVTRTLCAVVIPRERHSP